MTKGRSVERDKELINSLDEDVRNKLFVCLGLILINDVDTDNHLRELSAMLKNEPDETRYAVGDILYVAYYEVSRQMGEQFYESLNSIDIYHEATVDDFNSDYLDEDCGMDVDKEEGVIRKKKVS